jgi:2,3-dihydroxybiphenyl 1,2-dioxygenase
MSVSSLGYVVVEATDLPAWKEFAVDLLGMQAAGESAERLLLRMDDYSYRFEIRLAAHDGVATLGWEVRSAAELRDLEVRLEQAGHAVKRPDEAMVRRRMVTELVSSHDPDGLPLEFFYGMQKSRQRFVSPLAARFVTGSGGLGHAFQAVRDNEEYRAFYCDLLGFHVSDFIDFGDQFGTFAHCNPRHHSFAWAHLANRLAGVGHLMVEVDELDLVGRAWDKVAAGAAPVHSTFGKHSNDGMLSFYVKTPSGFALEYGFAGKLVDCATWTPARYDGASLWGHKHKDAEEPDV